MKANIFVLLTTTLITTNIFADELQEVKSSLTKNCMNVFSFTYKECLGIGGTRVFIGNDDHPKIDFIVNNEISLSVDLKKVSAHLPQEIKLTDADNYSIEFEDQIHWHYQENKKSHENEVIGVSVDLNIHDETSNSIFFKGVILISMNNKINKFCIVKISPNGASDADVSNLLISKDSKCR